MAGPAVVFWVRMFFIFPIQTNVKSDGNVSLEVIEVKLVDSEYYLKREQVNVIMHIDIKLY